MIDNSFFLQQIPQSEYRRTRKRKESESTFLSTTLNPIGITDPLVINELKAHIESQAELIFSTLLPNETWNLQSRDTLLQKIYVELGIV